MLVVSCWSQFLLLHFIAISYLIYFLFLQSRLWLLDVTRNNAFIYARKRRRLSIYQFFMKLILVKLFCTSLRNCWNHIWTVFPFFQCLPGLYLILCKQPLFESNLNKENPSKLKSIKTIPKQPECFNYSC